MTDPEIIDWAVAAATSPQPPREAEMALLAAIVQTREEGRRHELAQQARAQVDQITSVGLAILGRVFGVALG